MPDRMAIYQAHIAVHDAYVSGDLAALTAALGDPPEFPNARTPLILAAGDHCLEYAVYWSPLPFIRTLLDIGATPIIRTMLAFRR